MENKFPLEDSEDQIHSESETTRLSLFHMLITAFLLLAFVALVILFALFSPKSVFSRIEELRAKRSTEQTLPSPEQTILPTQTPEDVPQVSPSPFASSSPSVTPSPSPIEKIIMKPAGQDGYVTDGGTVNVSENIDVGRTPDAIHRGFVGFDLSEIPVTAKLSKATLRLYQRAVAGTPYASLGTLSIDHLDVGTTLAAESYNGGNVFELSFAPFGSDKAGEWKTADVTKQVSKDRSLHTSSQFRIHFTTETKGGTAPGDIASFSSGNNGSEAPQLVVEYY